MYTVSIADTVELQIDRCFEKVFSYINISSSWIEVYKLCVITK